MVSILPPQPSGELAADESPFIIISSPSFTVVLVPSVIIKQSFTLSEPVPPPVHVAPSWLPHVIANAPPLPHVCSAHGIICLGLIFAFAPLISAVAPISVLCMSALKNKVTVSELSNAVFDAPSVLFAFTNSTSANTGIGILFFATVVFCPAGSAFIPRTLNGFISIPFHTLTNP